MGVYIKGMEMPKSCAECDAEGHYENSYGDEYGFFCPFCYKAYTEETRDAKRLDNCPLVPIPPHGDLIDRDAFIEFIKTHWDSYDQWFVDQLEARPTIIPADDKDINVPTKIDLEPTIIEAEEGNT